MKELKRCEYPNDWPPEEFSESHLDVSREQLNTFKSMIENNAGETAIVEFLKSNKGLLVNGLREFKTGNHSAWVIPKQTIRPPFTKSQKGLIPDYI